ncbi:hypothetical protein B0H17DRAFT_1144736 [Mycena rosella]|uniref:Uncharacterized protein n=1 Tax=Mycena rosella TaxID=1033263 RepID=A0AAD7G6P0_MYCRO|nr:hypothetical protein B0H17DRAFT_1144736 [Mycena rosella]
MSPVPSQSLKFPRSLAIAHSPSRADYPVQIDVSVTAAACAMPFVDRPPGCLPRGRGLLRADRLYSHVPLSKDHASGTFKASIMSFTNTAAQTSFGESTGLITDIPHYHRQVSLVVPYFLLIQPDLVACIIFASAAEKSQLLVDLVNHNIKLLQKRPDFAASIMTSARAEFPKEAHADKLLDRLGKLDPTAGGDGLAHVHIRISVLAVDSKDSSRIGTFGYDRCPRRSEQRWIMLTDSEEKLCRNDCPPLGTAAGRVAARTF